MFFPMNDLTFPLIVQLKWEYLPDSISPTKNKKSIRIIKKIYHFLIYFCVTEWINFQKTSTKFRKCYRTFTYRAFSRYVQKVLKKMP
jgi:hypothetical protein